MGIGPSFLLSLVCVECGSFSTTCHLFSRLLAVTFMGNVNAQRRINDYPPRGRPNHEEDHRWNGSDPFRRLPGMVNEDRVTVGAFLQRMVAHVSQLPWVPCCVIYVRVGNRSCRGCHNSCPEWEVCPGNNQFMRSQRDAARGTNYRRNHVSCVRGCPRHRSDRQRPTLPFRRW